MSGPHEWESWEPYEWESYGSIEAPAAPLIRVTLVGFEDAVRCVDGGTFAITFAITFCGFADSAGVTSVGVSRAVSFSACPSSRNSVSVDTSIASPRVALAAYSLTSAMHAAAAASRFDFVSLTTATAGRARIASTSGILWPYRGIGIVPSTSGPEPSSASTLGRKR